MDTSNITIETKNLYLTGITLKYKDDIFKEFTPEITTYMSPKSPEKIEETIKFINDSTKKNKEGLSFQVAILDKKSKKFLGGGGVNHINRKTPELGIWIKESAHGHGYGKETIIALKEWVDKNLSYEYILYRADEENYPSKRIPEFLNGKVEREYDTFNMSGKEQHVLEYRIYPLKK